MENIENIENIENMTDASDLREVMWDTSATLARVASMEEFQRLWAGLDATRRMEVEHFIGANHQTDESWLMSGYCEACQAAANFAVDWHYSNHVVPNYRERLQCPACGLNNRQRFVAGYLRRMAHNRSLDVYLYEQVTPLYHWATQQLAQCAVVGSEYLGPDIAPGSIIDGIRHEDALNLTFPTESLDVIVSTDVYEHVPDMNKTAAEAARVLRPGGRLVFSVPFNSGQYQTIQRAKLDEHGQIQHLLPPEYHGNPISPETGSLVFSFYGWDLFDMLRASGFSDVYALAYYSYFFGNIGEGLQLIFVAER